MAADRDAVREAGLRVLDLLSSTTTLRLALQRAAAVAGADALPSRLRERLRAPEPIPWGDVQRILRDAWGDPPERVLGSIEREPVAVTAAAQVHRATDSDGVALAVKVGRPGLTELVRSDLMLLEPAAAIVAGIAPRAELGAIVRELRERLLDELDLEHEAGQQRQVARRARRSGRYVVPMPRSELCHDRVLVAEWVDGRPLRALAGASEAERMEAAELAVRFFAGVVAQTGVIHADPDPDDLLLLDGGRLAVLDFGALRSVDAERLEPARRGVDALIERDGAALAAVLVELGLLTDAKPADGEAILDLVDAAAGELLRGEAALDEHALRAGARVLAARGDEVAALLARASIEPQDLWPARAIVQLGAVLAPLALRRDWLALARDALRDGWG